MSLARRIAASTRSVAFEQLPAEVVEKVKVCLMDFLSAAYESLDLPWSLQALRIAGEERGHAAIIGSNLRVPVGDAAFVNGVLGHGLVREDMHTGSVSHIGVVVFPTLLALSHDSPAAGSDLIAAAVCGYEVSAQIGRALMTPENVRQYRPTGICGPPGAALAAARLLGLDEDASVSALAFGANAAAGLNEWPYSGGDEMFFHVGFAARNAVLAALLAQAGANCSETSLDGTAGLFRALRSQDRAGDVKPFDSGYEILSVFHKPAPACNYAQTAAQAALALSGDLRQRGLSTADVASIRVRSTAAAIAYPGCNHPGPFLKTLQAKMSIHYCVAATLLRGEIAEANYRMLDHPEIARLASATVLEPDAGLSRLVPIPARLRGHPHSARRFYPGPAPARCHPGHARRNSRPFSARRGAGSRPGCGAGTGSGHRHTGVAAAHRAPGRSHRNQHSFMQKYKLLINGQWVDPQSGEWFETENPYTGAAWALIPKCGKPEVDAAVAAAKAAFHEKSSWRRMTASARGALLRKLGDLIARDADALAAIETRDNGKLYAEMRGQLGYIPQWYYYFGGLADKIEGSVIPIDKPGVFNYTREEPLGVIAAITPWNSPLMLATWKLAPALAAGNTVVWKPSEFSSASALEMGRLFEEAGFPPGVVNIVTGFGADTGEPLVTHPDVAKVAFTGGDKTGEAVYGMAARGIKHVTLELGAESGQHRLRRRFHRGCGQGRRLRHLRRHRPDLHRRLPRPDSSVHSR